MSQPSTNVSQIRGLDVSHFQQTVDWNQVAPAGYAYAFVKATEGITYVDPMFATNWDGAKSAGLLRGAYHFFEANDDAAQQAEAFLKAVHLVTGDLPPVLDVEATSTSAQVPTATIVQRIEVWLQTVGQALACTPIVYTDRGFWNGLKTELFSSYPLWVADYGVATPALPNGWTSWTFWQYTQSGQVPGIQAAVDLDLFQGSLEDLQRLALVVGQV